MLAEDAYFFTPEPEIQWIATEAAAKGVEDLTFNPQTQAFVVWSRVADVIGGTAMSNMTELLIIFSDNEIARTEGGKEGVPNAFVDARHNQPVREFLEFLVSTGSTNTSAANEALRARRGFWNMSTAPGSYAEFDFEAAWETAAEGDAVGGQDAPQGDMGDMLVPTAVAGFGFLIFIYGIVQFMRTRATTAKYRPLVKEMYEKYNKEKLGDVEKVLSSYRGQEELLMQKLKEKYEKGGESKKDS